MEKYTGLEIAVIGLAGRFPGAGNIAQYWDNLKSGKDCITDFSEQELLTAGETPELLDDPFYIRSHAYLANKHHFDAAFFDYRPDEAELMDPQLRILHECCWEALEDAGYGHAAHREKIGLFASGSPNFNWILYSMIKNGERLVDEFTTANIREVTFLSSRVAYKLNLTGPAVFTQTACSSSLVTIHQACCSLLLGECTMALAGGITIANYSKKGYLYEEGMIYSKTGRCRPFDIHSDGTVNGEGAGVVVLKRLSDALRDRDPIYAVIKGSAINNDGRDKVGYAAPGVNGQVDVIRRAIKMAGIASDTIGYVEAHGTATELGDPIEIEALNEAFHQMGKCTGRSCAIGSVKSSIGHLDSAAGVAGFIKAVLAIKHKLIPPSLHFTAPNPKIDFDNGPFYVNSVLQEWKNSTGPLRAGVSSFGIGGTNAHVILEEAPQQAPSQPGRDYQLLVLSAKTEEALERNTSRLVTALAADNDSGLADIAYTLQTGRERFPFRRMLIGQGKEDAIHKLSARQYLSWKAKNTQEGLQNIVFMFSGQGSQYIDMCKGLYKGEKLFREKVDECLAIAQQYSTASLYDILFPDGGEEAIARIQDTRYAQPLLFIIEYSLAYLLMTWGVRPHYMIGHSIGEYVAACHSNVFSLRDAIRLVIRRGELMSEVEQGSMLSVSIGEEAARPILASINRVDLAVINGPASLVVAGKNSDIEAFEREAANRGYTSKKLRTSHAFHSYMMDEILHRFEQEVAEVTIREPEIPYISNISGDFVTYDRISTPSYWSRQLRSTVHFMKGGEQLLSQGKGIFIELGPGRSLCNYLAESRLINDGHVMINMIRQYNQEVDDHRYFTEKLGQLWLHGVAIKWDKYYEGEKRRRLSLPAYSFEPTAFTTDVNAFKLAEERFRVHKDSHDATVQAITIPVWQPTLSPDNADELTEKQFTFLLFSGAETWSALLMEKLATAGHRVIQVKFGDSWKQVTGNLYEMNTGAAEDHLELWKHLNEKGIAIDHILYCAALTGQVERVAYEVMEKRLNSGYFGLSFLARALALYPPSRPVNLTVINNYLTKITAGDEVDPLKCTILGPAKIIPLELREVRSKVIDIPYPFDSEATASHYLESVLKEMFFITEDPLVVYRHQERWVPHYQPVQESDKIKSGIRIAEKGVYIITGAMGGMGFSIARWLVLERRANVVLVYRSDFPERVHWEHHLAENGEDNATSRRIRELIMLESTGCTVDLYQVNVSNEEQVSAFARTLRQRYTTLNGLIWAAGEVDYGGILMNREKKDLIKYISSKVHGLLLFDKHLDFGTLDFVALFSSMGNVFYQTKFGQAAYNAANEFLESYSYYARKRKGTHIFTINWCDWLDVGMTVRSIQQQTGSKDTKAVNRKIKHGIKPDKGVTIFEKCLQSKAPVSLIYNASIQHALTTYRQQYQEVNKKLTQATALLATPVAGNDIEAKLTAVFSRFFGKQVGPNEDFFELGLDSLKALTLIYNISETFGVRLSFVELFKKSTISALSELLIEQLTHAVPDHHLP